MNNTSKSPEETNDLYLLFNDALLVLGFIWRSVKRHMGKTILIALAVIGLSVAMVVLTNPIYEANARILTNPSRTLIQLGPYEGRFSAAELIKSRENITAVVEDTDLINQWRQSRTTGIQKLKNDLRVSLFGPPSDDAIRKLVTNGVKEGLGVYVDQSVITITMQWTDPHVAVKLVNAFVERFLEDQFQRENAQYILSIENTEKRLARADDQLKDAETKYAAVQETLNALTGQEASSEADAAMSPSNAERMARLEKADAAATVDKLERELSLKMQELSAAEKTYIMRQAEAKNKLSEMQLTMGPQHPDVVRAKRLVNILASPPAALEQIREEHDRLSRQLERTGRRFASTRTFRSSRSSRTDSSPARLSPEAIAAQAEEETLFAEYGKAKIARNKIFEELENAKIEHEAARTALDFRYKVTQPPVLPEAPIKPNPPKIIIAAIVAGLFLGVFLAVFFDLKTGLVMETWQLSRILHVPVLGETDET